MHEINNITGPAKTLPITQQQPGADRQAPKSDYNEPADRVEISDLGAFAAKLKDLPAARVQRVAQIRAEIEAGTYETSDRINGTVDRLLQELS